jgi:large subunit ribosomal protein L21
MFALVDIKGKQYKLEEGRYLDVDLLDQQPEAELVLDNVLMVVDGSNTLVGAPYVDGAKATVQVVDHRRDAKVIVYKMRCKKGYRLKNGHRQDYTRIQVNLLEFPGKTASKKAAVASSDETAAAPKAKKAAKKAEEVTSDAE